MTSFKGKDSRIGKETADVLKDFGQGGSLHGELESEAKPVSRRHESIVSLLGERVINLSRSILSKCLDGFISEKSCFVSPYRYPKFNVSDMLCKMAVVA